MDNIVNFCRTCDRVKLIVMLSLSVSMDGHHHKHISSPEYITPETENSRVKLIKETFCVCWCHVLR
jgi:hypothetical protein